jgi:hypothetical protein
VLTPVERTSGRHVAAELSIPCSRTSGSPSPSHRRARSVRPSRSVRVWTRSRRWTGRAERGRVLSILRVSICSAAGAHHGGALRVVVRSAAPRAVRGRCRHAFEAAKSTSGVASCARAATRTGSRRSSGPASRICRFWMRRSAKPASPCRCRPHIELAAHVRAREAELVRAPHEAAQGLRRPQDDARLARGGPKQLPSQARRPTGSGRPSKRSARPPAARRVTSPCATGGASIPTAECPHVSAGIRLPASEGLARPGSHGRHDDRPFAVPTSPQHTGASTAKRIAATVAERASPRTLPVCAVSEERRRIGV